MQNHRFGWVLASANVAAAAIAIMLTSFTGIDPTLLIG